LIIACKAVTVRYFVMPPALCSTYEALQAVVKNIGT
jgi:hypothetical protein